MGGYSGLRLTASPLRSPVLALAVALPIVFVHIRYQPSLVVGSGTKVTVTLADLAILAVALVTLAVAVRARLRPLRAGLPLWIAGGVFLLYGIARAGNGTHLVSAVKFAEYGVLALAVPVLVRGRDELRLLLWTVALWSAVASIVGLAQFFGAGLADGWGAGMRQPSFLGQLDFAALSGMALAAGLAGLAFGAGRVAGGDSGRERGAGLLVGIATVAGGLGLILSASVAALAGVAAVTAAIAVLAVRHRSLAVRPLALGAVAVALVAAGTLGLRGGDLVQFTRFLGISQKVESTTADVQTYSQRTVLVYIGWEVFKQHKAVGAGWGASADPTVFEPILPAAQRRFPDAAPLSFPSRENQWGVQNAYVQVLADLGLVGALLLAATLLAGGWVAARSALARGGSGAPAGALALSWALVTMGVWAALGLISGVPADAALWLGLGLAAAAPALAAPAPTEGGTDA